MNLKESLSVLVDLLKHCKTNQIATIYRVVISIQLERLIRCTLLKLNLYTMSNLTLLLQKILNFASLIKPRLT